MTSIISLQLVRKIEKVRIILMDVDGVMTDGGLFYGNQGEEIIKFNIQDGFGIRMARLAGLKTGLITGRHSEAVSRRARELKIDMVIQGVYHKLPAYLEILKSTGYTDNDVCYIGDDLLDLDIMERAGLAVAPSDGRNEIRQIADFITEEPGGRGAVRKVIETVIKGQGKWDEVIKQIRWTEEYGNRLTNSQANGCIQPDSESDDSE
jgi:3-deoxy-D-manno-octulosonate 8-phosphate phosphatase (KDO 8-P phosphatase)